MASHNEFGKEAERLAQGYLAKKGYEILFTNWRYSHYEIDIIAIKENVLHFIEVKARRSSIFGYPEDNVNKQKFQRLVLAGTEFLLQHPAYKQVQYDILSIIIEKAKATEYFLVEDINLF